MWTQVFPRVCLYHLFTVKPFAQGSPITTATRALLKFLSLKKLFSNVFRFVLFFYLFLAVLDHRCRARAFSGCGEWGLLFVVVRGLLIAVASRCRARALGTWASHCRGFSCGARAPGARASVVVARGL